jgi:hypothetical protein
MAFLAEVVVFQAVIPERGGWIFWMRVLPDVFMTLDAGVPSTAMGGGEVKHRIDGQAKRFT